MRSAQVPRRTPVSKIVAACLAGGVLWLLLVADLQPQEIVAGLACTAVSVAFMVFVARQTQSPRRFPPRDLTQIAHVPGAILSDSFRVSRFLLRSLVHRDLEPTGYVTVDFAPGGARPQREGRKVLAVLFTTAGPNTITLGVSDQEGCMMQHMLEAAPTSPMVRALAMQGERR